MCKLLINCEINRVLNVFASTGLCLPRSKIRIQSLVRQKIFQIQWYKSLLPPEKKNVPLQS